MAKITSVIRKNHEYDHVYLYTTHKGLYEKSGWEFMEETDTFPGERRQNIYRLEIK